MEKVGEPKDILRQITRKQPKIFLIEEQYSSKEFWEAKIPDENLKSAGVYFAHLFAYLNKLRSKLQIREQPLICIDFHVPHDGEEDYYIILVESWQSAYFSLPFIARMTDFYNSGEDPTLAGNITDIAALDAMCITFPLAGLGPIDDETRIGLAREWNLSEDIIDYLEGQSELETA